MRNPSPPSGENSAGCGDANGGSSTPPGGTGARLDRATRSWEWAGYAVRYRDPFLVQLIKRGQPDFWLLVPLVALGMLAAALIIALLRRLLRARWHVVELTETPDGRIITHQMWSPQPPDD